jgi:hypothetical protein
VLEKQVSSANLGTTILHKTVISDLLEEHQSSGFIHFNEKEIRNFKLHRIITKELKSISTINNVPLLRVHEGLRFVIGKKLGLMHVF